MMAAPNAPTRAAVAPALWQQLHAVALVLVAVRAGQSWSTAQFLVENQLRPGVQALVFAVWRHWGTAQTLRGMLAARAPAPAADALLCAALALLLAGAQDEDAPQYDPHTLVNQTVQAAKNQRNTRAQASFINACLRRFLRERDALIAKAVQHSIARYNHPDWWVSRLQKDHPDQWEAVLAANDTPAPLTLRINTTKLPLDQYTNALTAINLIAKSVGNYAIELSASTHVPSLPGYAQGWFAVQDAAAQQAAPLLLQPFVTPVEGGALPANVQTPLRVLDACAAPGGKTAHLLEFAQLHQLPIEVIALDVDAQRCERIAQNLARLGQHAQIVTADAADTRLWWDGQQMDAILLDAPCTASGIVRRHPDIRWLRRETDVAQLAGEQKRLLQALWPLLKPGGFLLYCTCSVFHEEGHNQIQTFVARNTDALNIPTLGHLIPQKHSKNNDLPHNRLGAHDGFFYALLQKTPGLAPLG